jgi:hypothetical protein
MLGTGQIRGPCWRAGWVSARALFTHAESWCGRPSFSSWRICIFCEHSNSLGIRACFFGFVWFFPLFFSLVVLFFGYTSIGSPVQWDLSFGECWGSRWPPPARGFWGSGRYVAWCYVPLFYTYMHIYRDVWNWLVFSIIVYPKLRIFFYYVTYVVYLLFCWGKWSLVKPQQAQIWGCAGQCVCSVGVRIVNMYLFSGFACMLIALWLLYSNEVFNIYMLCSTIFNSCSRVFFGHSWGFVHTKHPAVTQS